MWKQKKIQILPRINRSNYSNNYREQATSLYQNKSHLHPLLSDFDEVAKNQHSTFPYKYMVYGGNHWETLISVVHQRGFTLVLYGFLDRIATNKRRRTP